MSAAGVTFKCGACGNLMAVGPELQGRPVRCPHCRRVVQVPALQNVPVAEAGTRAASSSPAEAPGAADVHIPFIMPDEADHILTASEAPQDELFSDGTPAVIPALPELPTVAEPSPWSKLSDLSSEAPLPPTRQEFTLPEPLAPVVNCEESRLEQTFVDNPVSSPSASPPAGDAKSWQNEPTLVMGTVSPAPVAEAPSRPGPRPRVKLPVAFWLVALLLPFAFIIIPVVSVVTYNRVAAPKAIHPLEFIQDDGLYREFQEGKVPEAIDPIQDLPKDLKPLRPGQTGRFGALEITPLEIVRQKLPYSYYRGAEGYVSSEDVLVLRLRIKNISDIILHPHDPTFNRAYRQGHQPYAYLTLGGKNYYGSVIDPLTERVKGQNFGELLPGAEMETIFVAAQDTGAGRAADELKKAPSAQSVIWRVHLRRGREPIRGRQVWVTTVIPIEFTPADVKEPKD